MKTSAWILTASLVVGFHVSPAWAIVLNAGDSYSWSFSQSDFAYQETFDYDSTDLWISFNPMTEVPYDPALDVVIGQLVVDIYDNDTDASPGYSFPLDITAYTGGWSFGIYDPLVWDDLEGRIVLTATGSMDIASISIGTTTSNYQYFVANASIPSPVPVPAAAWLFGSGLLGLIGVVQRNRVA